MKVLSTTSAFSSRLIRLATSPYTSAGALLLGWGSSLWLRSWQSNRPLAAVLTSPYEESSELIQACYEQDLLKEFFTRKELLELAANLDKQVDDLGDPITTALTSLEPTISHKEATLLIGLKHLYKLAPDNAELATWKEQLAALHKNVAESLQDPSGLWSKREEVKGFIQAFEKEAGEAMERSALANWYAAYTEAANTPLSSQELIQRGLKTDDTKSRTSYSREEIGHAIEQISANIATNRPEPEVVAPTLAPKYWWVPGALATLMVVGGLVAKYQLQTEVNRK